MPYNARDLMVNIAAVEAAGAARQPFFYPCLFFTYHQPCIAWSGCLHTIPHCVFTWHCNLSGPDPGAGGAIDPAAATQQLGALKVQLQQALAEIETQERALELSSQPQTVAQVEEKERKLHEELAKLDKRKKELAKG